MRMRIFDKKSHRLALYNYNQNGVFFITICTLDRKKILSRIAVETPLPGCPGPPKIELLRHGSIADRYIHQLNSFYDHLSVEKYVIMPDHIHLLIAVNGHPGMDASAKRTSLIGQFVGTLKRFCNREYGENIWQNGYYDHVVRNQTDYDSIWEYIDHNPHKWILKNQDRE